MADLKEKIAEVMSSPQVMPLATVTEEGKPWVRFMVGAAGPDLTVMFATDKRTRKIQQIEKNNQVHITAGGQNPMDSPGYVQYQGQAHFTQDEKLRKMLWNDKLERYWKGPDDENYGVLVVKPQRIEYMSMESWEPQVWKAE